MTKKSITLLLLAVCCVLPIKAQRKTDALGRGLVVVPTGATNGSTTNFVSWRRLAEEYYNVTYNLYKDGSLLASKLTTTSYNDNNNAYTTSNYQVEAVVNGVLQPKCAAQKAWNQYVYKLDNTRTPTGYIDLTLYPVYDRRGNNVSSHYFPNDAEMADLDGDGELEIIIKRLNEWDACNDLDGNGTVNTELYSASNTTEFSIIEAYDVNWQSGVVTRLWWIDVGPNMVSLNSTELNFIAYDWDEDGKAEVVIRGADDMRIHMADGNERIIGTAGLSYRNSMSSHTDAQYAWTKDGAEFLIYMNGQTGAPYQVIDYPLPRSSANAWGYGSGSPTNDSYGHRSTKHFLGAPVLDGRKASLFLARGVYGRHWMKAFDIDASAHTLVERWNWECNDRNSSWYGQGYHNFVIADVDEDGRDEIVYGSMVIDDNGKGLSTTGLGHGDAQHVSDFDPYREGLEFFGCNEDHPGMNYRNATTSEIYVRRTASKDDGRGLMANFSNSYPGSIGRSVSSNIISSVTDKDVTGMEGDSYIAWSDLNFRIFWDGDLCSEIFNSPGTAREAKVDKPGMGRLFTSSGCNLNNDSKNNACFVGDIIGDWREEMVVRQGHNVRIYTSGLSTNYTLPTLWHDYQYRQAMVWQMMCYNQPAHLSYFLGEMEGYTTAPPPLSLTNRYEVSNGGTIVTAYNDKHMLLHGYENMSATLAANAHPSVITVNAPSWTQGHDNNNYITTSYYTHTLGGAALSGSTILTKQGKGVLNLSNNTHTHTGATMVWGGTLNFDGTMQNSPVTMHRFTTLNSTGGTFKGGITMEYGATLNVGGAVSGKISTVNVSTLNMGYGSRVVVDFNGTGDNEHDWINADKLIVDDSKRGVEAWEDFGPQYITPVFQLRFGHTLASGIYPIGNVAEVVGDLDKVVVESTGMPASSFTLVHQDGKLCINVGGVPMANEPVIALTGMSAHDLGSLYPTLPGSNNCYLPVVSVTRTPTNGITPSLSATFTNLNGEVTELGNELPTNFLTENYENSTNASSWQSPSAADNLKLVGGDATYGKYISFDFSSTSTNSRCAYTSFTNLNVTTNTYVIEFDASLKPGALNNSNSQTSELAIMAGGSITNNWNYYYVNSGNYCLFDVSQEDKSNVNYIVNGTSTKVVIPSDVWCHYSVMVDREARKTTWRIINKSTNSLIGSGEYYLPNECNTLPTGIYLLAGRYYPVLKIDNIAINSMPHDLSTFAFTEPGTFTVTASLGGDAGYAPASASFLVENPYKILYESHDYNTIVVDDASSVLGSHWHVCNPVNLDARGWDRFANWAKITYSFAYNDVNTPNETMYVDQDRVLWVDYTNSDQALHLVQRYGLGQCGGSTFHAKGMGDENTIIYHRYDYGLGKTTDILEEYIQGQADGNYVYGSTLGALQKFVAYVPLKALWGDLNHDGSVTVTDVTVLVNYILGTPNAVPDEADLNYDGSVTVTDVTCLVNFLLGL